MTERRVKIELRIFPSEAPSLLRWLYDRNRRLVRRDAAEGRDPFAVMHGLQTGRIKYIQRDPREHWKDRAEILVDGGGDCEDLASAVTAELNEALYLPGLGASFEGRPAPLPPPLEGHKGGLSRAWEPQGEEAATAIYSPRPGLYHVLVWTPTWGYIDPSVAGGMGSKGLLRQPGKAPFVGRTPGKAGAVMRSWSLKSP